jgi:sigma-E factor negative regulatory protein RseA
MDRLSALMDSELDTQEARLEIRRLKDHEELCTAWETFHLIGDVLRGDRQMLSTDFAARLRARLTEEATVMAPGRWRLPQPVVYGLSAAASLCAIAVIAWFVLPFGGGVAPAGQVALAAPAAGRISEYLIAHQEFSPSSALQGLAPYIRTVSVNQDEIGQ